MRHTKPKTNIRLRALRLIIGPVLWTLAVACAVAPLGVNNWSRSHHHYVFAIWVVGLVFGALDAIVIRRGTHRLRSRLDRYRRLFDQGHEPALVFECLPDGSFGKVLQANEALSELLLAPKEALVGRQAGDLFHETGTELQKAISESVEKRGRAALGTRLVEEDGSTIPVEAEFVPFELDSGSAIVMYAVGLRDGSSIERALRRRSRQLSVLSSATRRLNEELDMATILDHLVQAAMEVVSATSAAAGLAEGDEIVLQARGSKGDHPREGLRLKRGEGVVGRVWETMAPYISNDVPRDPHARDLAEQDVISVAALPIVDRHGTLLGYLEVHDRADGRPFDDEDVVILVGLAASAAIAIDNTRSVEQLLETRFQLLADRMRCRSLAAELSSVSERERRAIASELHDQIGQLLAIARIKLMQATAEDGTPVGVGEACALVEQAVTETRSLTFQLSPPLLYELGLGAAIEWLAEETERRHGTPTTCHAAPLPEGMPDDVRALLYVCTRELILNAVKHAGASRIEVSVGCVLELIRIVVRDDGRGFDPEAARSTSTYGLFSVGERLSGFGGTLEVRSAPGHGTTAIMDLPVQAEAFEPAEEIA